MNIRKKDMERKTKKDFVIAFDFDGTLCEEDGSWPLCGPPKHDMIEAAKMLYDFGFQIIIWSLRGKHDHFAHTHCLRFLEDHDISYDNFNMSTPYIVAYYGGHIKGNPRKVNADIYIDDRNAGGLVTAKQLIQDVIIRYYRKVTGGKCILTNQEIDEEFIDAYVEKYLTGTKLRRTIRPEDE
jgi:hypothetical protein